MKDVQGHLESGELLLSFLDDVYVVCLPHRVALNLNLLGDRLSTMAGIRLQEGKTRVWNKGGKCPEEIAELGPEVWSPEGVKILGTPVEEFVARVVAERIGGGTEVVGRAALAP